MYARIFESTASRLRRIALRNCEITGMPAGAAEGVFPSLGRMLRTFALLPSRNASNISEWIRYDGFEHFEEAKRRGNGVLFATLHLGNWELSAFAHALMAEPMYVVVRPLDNPLLDAFVARRRSLSGNVILGKKSATRELLRALRENRAVGILVDQNVGLQEGVFVDFFGTKACVSPTFARIAARTGAAVIPGYAVWSEAERRFVLRFDPIVPMTGEETVDTQRIQTALETAIRRYPDQWLWIHRRFKTRPEGEPQIYL